LHLVERDLVHGLEKDDRSLGAKLALTPPAMVLDLLLGWFLDPLGLTMCGCDDDEQDERKQGR